MKTRGYIVGVAFITLSLLGALTVYGDPGGRCDGRHFGHERGGFPFRVLRALDLTDEQQKQVQALTESRKETMRNLRKELYTINSEVTDKLLASGEMTTDSFANASEQVATLEAQLRCVNSLVYFLGLLSILAERIFSTWRGALFFPP